MGLMNGLMGNAGKIDPAAAQAEYARLLGNGEQIHAAYLLVRDAFLFTNRRLILVDKQGITGKKIEYHSVLYKSITHFAVETAGNFDLDAELKIWISGNPVPLQKRFSKSVDIYEVQAILSHFVAG
ncbi:MAG: PH domain-containing protein [Rhodococcus sp. (in: high G+C Gram-positive bacteria)]